MMNLIEKIRKFNNDKLKTWIKDNERKIKDLYAEINEEQSQDHSARYYESLYERIDELKEEIEAYKAVLEERE